MERREFVVAAGVAVLRGTAGLTDGRTGEAPHGPTVRSSDRPGLQEPTLGPEVFARRFDRAQQELLTRKWDLLLATPSTNFQYFTGYNPGRSERLIALVLPAKGTPAIVCPAFEVERLKRNGAVADVRGWEEQDNPYNLVRDAVRATRQHGSGTIALEPSTEYATYLRLRDKLSSWDFKDAAPITERLRIIKYPEEVALLRRAIEITQAAIAATFARLAVGMSEQEVAQVLSREMQSRGALGEGLVQFGPDSALPHGHATGTTLTRETVVLIDCGCRVGGYTSDITRTVWFGETPAEEFQRVFNLVHDAQTAAIELGKPLVTRCEEMDRVARRVIADGGYGQYFVHRLGHGLGMDGHEVPYLVEGNGTRLEPQMVFTIEPGIYQPGKFGVRIEDDCLMTEGGVEVLSQRAAKL